MSMQVGGSAFRLKKLSMDTLVHLNFDFLVMDSQL